MVGGPPPFAHTLTRTSHLAYPAIPARPLAYPRAPHLTYPVHHTWRGVPAMPASHLPYPVHHSWPTLGRHTSYTLRSQSTYPVAPHLAYPAITLHLPYAYPTTPPLAYPETQFAYPAILHHQSRPSPSILPPLFTYPTTPSRQKSPKNKPSEKIPPRARDSPTRAAAAHLSYPAIYRPTLPSPPPAPLRAGAAGPSAPLPAP